MNIMKKLLIVVAILAMGLPTLSAQKLRLMSYNIHNTAGMDGVRSVKRIGDVISKFQPDVVALQEVDSITRRNKVYQVGELAKQTGYYGYYMQTIPYGGGAYGNGLLSKEEALSVKRIPLPCRREPRGMLLVEFKKYYYASLHLSLVKADQLASVEIVREELSKLDKPVMIAGDLNARPNSATMKAFAEFMTILNDTKKCTFSSVTPSHCIDYIMGCGANYTVLKSYVDFYNQASDHLPLYVDVKIKKAKRGKK